MAVETTIAKDKAEAEHEAPQAFAQAQVKKQRTTGNKIFDWLVYPSIAFGAVLVASVALLDFAFERQGRIRNLQEGLSAKLAGFLKHVPFHGDLSNDALAGKAQNYVKIGVSFTVGTVLMAPIKWLEDARGKISSFFDRGLNTEPKDKSKFAEEPEQSWKSVLGGRGITFVSILAIGTVLGDKYTKLITHWIADKGVELAKYLKPGLSEQAVGNLQKHGRNTAFEGFYTLCTTMLVYAISRTLARSFGKNKNDTAAMQPDEQPAVPHAKETKADASVYVDPESKAYHAKPERRESYVAALHQNREQATSAAWAKA